MKRMHLRIAVAAGLMSAAAVGMASAMTTPAAPASTEWCAVYRTGSENCYFTTEKQCLDNVSGLGGFCRMSYYSAAQSRRG
jgi:uncharacterized membrane protein